jgi:hypothetical protein
VKGKALHRVLHDPGYLRDRESEQQADLVCFSPCFRCLYAAYISHSRMVSRRYNASGLLHLRWLAATPLLFLLALNCLKPPTSVSAHPDASTEAVDLIEEYTAISNSSLRWLQRPNLYFGMRARVQGDSPLFGIAWFGTADYNGYQSQ